MKRLGYTKFVAQGGDWGAVIVDLMGVQAPPELLGIHTNMAGIFPADIDGAAFSGAPAPSGLSADEKLAYERLQFVYQKGIGYGYQLGLHPQTMYGIADSPVGLAAYFLDHDARSYALIARVFDGQSEGLTRDDILDNITITWLTNTAISGARLYWEYWGNRRPSVDSSTPRSGEVSGGRPARGAARRRNAHEPCNAPSPMCARFPVQRCLPGSAARCRRRAAIQRPGLSCTVKLWSSQCPLIITYRSPSPTDAPRSV